jgi:hypothetical protein
MNLSRLLSTVSYTREHLRLRSNLESSLQDWAQNLDGWWRPRKLSQRVPTRKNYKLMQEINSTWHDSKKYNQSNIPDFQHDSLETEGWNMDKLTIRVTINGNAIEAVTLSRGSNLSPLGYLRLSCDLRCTHEIYSLPMIHTQLRD